MRPSPDDAQELRRCVRDLVVLSTLPAFWSNAAPGTIADSLAEVLRRVLSLDLIFVRLRGPADGPPLEAAHGPQGALPARRAREVGEALGPWLHFESFYEPSSVPSPVGGGPVRLAVLPLGHGLDYGLLAAGSGRPDFATETERLLLRVAANQAAIVLQCRQAEEALRRAEQTSRFLADASATLAELCDSRSTFQKIAHLAVPLFADWCAADLFDEAGALERVAVTHADPAKAPLADELRRRYPPRPDQARGVGEVLRTGRPVLAEDVPDSLVAALAQDEEHLRLLRELGLRSYLCVPLLARGGALGALTFVTAESGRRYGAADLRASEDLARRAVVAVENANLYRALQETDRRKDEFLATLAHQLRNPLAPIRNALRILRLAGGNGEAVHSALDVMGQQVQHMVRLIDDLLDLSRISRGKIELRRERVELVTVLQNAIETSRPLIEAATHELVVTLPPARVWLEADPTRLAQVVANLLNNAAKYTREGGHIWLTAEQAGGQAVIRVRDSGIGIPPEMLPRIFEMFAQVDCSLERSLGGLGIGLTLVRALVKMHGGTVEAHSEGSGRGSEFVVRLPTAAERLGIPAPKKGLAEGMAPAAHARRILLVDDNVDAAQSLGLLLRMLGHDTCLVHDGAGALEAARAYRPDLVLLDIGLPGMNGYEIARRMRQQPGLRDVTLVAITGWGQEEDRRRGKEAGFDHHLTKPADLAAIDKLLASLSQPRP
jgi:signal transduction histidine kinase/ActR/RegA family two-component response regulator